MGKMSDALAGLRNIESDLRKLPYEIYMNVLDELCEKIAEEARKKAPTLKDEEKIYNIINSNNKTATLRSRRGPDKFKEYKKHRKNRENKTWGPIKDTITVIPSKKNNISKLVNSPAWYSHFVEFGTSPHPMKPNKLRGKKAMVVPVSDKDAVFSKEVNHPGIKANPFLRPAADLADDFLKEILKERGIKI